MVKTDVDETSGGRYKRPTSTYEEDAHVERHDDNVSVSDRTRKVSNDSIDQASPFDTEGDQQHQHRRLRIGDICEDQELIDAASTLARVAVASRGPSRRSFPAERDNRRNLRASASCVETHIFRKQRTTIRKRLATSMDGFVRDRVSKALKTDTGGVSGEDVDMENDHAMDDLTTARRLFDHNDLPRSPLVGLRGSAGLRGSQVSDDGASSIMDLEDEVCSAHPDSVPAMIAEIRRMLDYVAGKPSLHSGSASFMRDYLRTLLVQSSIVATEANHRINRDKLAGGNELAGIIDGDDVDGVVECSKRSECFRSLPDELAKHIFTFLDGKNLAYARMVCRKWNTIACEDSLWKTLCLKKWRSLETDDALWKLVFGNVCKKSPTRWRQVYPKLTSKTRFKCRLMKTGRFICNLNAHQLSGAPLKEDGLPSVLIVERRFNILHLRTFVLPEASILYFEPFDESDRNGFNDFIEYLIKRTRAGLALEEQRRFIFIPPCEYTKSYVGYEGNSLIGVVQNAYPPLAAA